MFFKRKKNTFLVFIKFGIMKIPKTNKKIKLFKNYNKIK